MLHCTSAGGRIRISACRDGDGRNGDSLSFSDDSTDISAFPQGILQAEGRVRPFVRETYLEPSPLLGETAGAEVFLKLENLQHTGSFKVRGALNKLLFLDPEERGRGVVAASTGNHGAAVAYASKLLAVPGTVFVPHGAAAGKVRAIESHGAQIRFVGQDPLETELAARRFASEAGLPYISPYNDLQVIAGQGTVGVELDRQLKSLDAVFVAVGGGGLVSGLASFLKSVQPQVKIIGCSPLRAPVMAECVRAGRIHDVPSLSTLSDATAGGLEEGSITFELCRALVDQWVEVSEAEIAEAMRWIITHHHLLVEGAAAVAVAGFSKLQDQMKGLRVVLILCGGNLGLETLRQVLDGDAGPA